MVFLIAWIIYWKLYGKKQAKQEKKRKEFKQKILIHIHNFSPTRLKNKSWQKSIGKYKKKRKNSAKQPKDKQK